MITERLNHILKAATALFALSLLVLLCVFFIREATKVSKWADSGEIANTRIDITEDSLFVFERVSEADFIAPPYPQIATRYSPSTTVPPLLSMSHTFRATVYEPDTIIPVTFLREGVEQKSEILLKSPIGKEYYQIILLQWLRFLIGFGFMSVGLWAFFKQPDSAAVRVFVLYCCSMTSFIISGVSISERNTRCLKSLSGR